MSNSIAVDQVEKDLEALLSKKQKLQQEFQDLRVKEQELSGKIVTNSGAIDYVQNLLEKARNEPAPKSEVASSVT